MTEPHTHLTSRSHTKPLSYTKPLSHIKTLLIANRGEIARRILHTAQQLGLKTVAVYTEADRDALHHRLADHRVLLHDTVTTDGTRCSGYLNIAEILRAAKACNADAIHPGYGFLSENADFAQAVCDAGLRYIGPHPQTIRRLGDKVTAKAFAQKLGIPTLPAITLNADTPLDATHLPQEGWPWLVKAAAGGGGRGMRVAHSATELISAVTQARSEAAQHFGNATVFLEKYLPQVRHIEIQVFGDTHGTVRHLWHRDCSAQRRHQKIVEEAPAPTLSPTTSEQLLAASIKLAQAAQYTNAGTVEFLLDESDNWYFLEVNTRLQVEHPVTEAITGEDLVAWQLWVADGQALPPQKFQAPPGHAIELRICAENPDQQFLPTTGTIDALHWPEHIDSKPALTTHEHPVRIDHALYAGLHIQPHFDSLLAKLIVWGPTRTEAIERAHAALSQIALRGIITNLDFHRTFINSTAFTTQRVFTTTLTLDDSIESNKLTSARRERALYQALTAATLIEGLTAVSSRRTDTHASPWETLRGWRNAEPHELSALWLHEHVLYRVTIVLNTTGLNTTDLNTADALPSHYPVRIQKQFANGMPCPHHDPLVDINCDFTLHHAPPSLDLFWPSSTPEDTTHNTTIIAHERSTFYWHPNAQSDDILTKTLDLRTRGHHFILQHPTPTYFTSNPNTDSNGDIQAPVPGIIKDVFVAVGDHVTRDAPLVMIESMKIEHEIRAPFTGVVTDVSVSVSDQVQHQHLLLTIQAEA